MKKEKEKVEEQSKSAKPQEEDSAEGQLNMQSPAKEDKTAEQPKSKAKEEVGEEKPKDAVSSGETSKDDNPKEKNEDTTKDDKENIKVYKEVYELIEKEIEDEYNWFKSFRTKAYAFITVVVSLLSIIMSTFEYDKLFDSLDDGIIYSTIVFICVFIFGISLLVLSFIFLYLSTKARGIDRLCPRILLEELAEKKFDNTNQFYKYIVKELSIDTHESIEESNKVKIVYYKIGIAIGIVALSILLISYVALRVLITR